MSRLPARQRGLQTVLYPPDYDPEDTGE